METADQLLLRIVWTWIGNYNDHSYDADDLIRDLEQAGYPCPEDLAD